MSDTTSAIEREKKRLPFGWGRFGKALDRLAELLEPGEVLESTAVGVFSAYREKWFGKYGVGETNVLLGVTDRRLFVMGTTLRGIPIDHDAPEWAELTEFMVVSDKKRSVAVSWSDGAVGIDSIAKSAYGGLVTAVAAHTDVRR
jgi:hypothetical protein